LGYTQIGFIIARFEGECVLKKSIYSTHSGILVDLLRTVRQEHKFTQVELAKRLAVPQSRVSKVESGERRMDLVELRAWCEALGIGLPRFVQRFEKALNRE
jgi:transcriptional regulator with XRE-family HTH domain